MGAMQNNTGKCRFGKEKDYRQQGYSRAGNARGEAVCIAAIRLMKARILKSTSFVLVSYFAHGKT